jgi:YfiH family protein
MNELWQAHRPNWKQVHGDQIALVESAGQECGSVDGLWSKSHRVPIGVVTADCVPILLAHREGKAVAAVHAGWRGTKARILNRLWEKLKVAGENPQEWVAAVGPAIGPCCYEVSEDLAAEFEKEFESLGSGLAVPKHRILDLPAINAEVLRKLGLPQVDLIRACTLCSKHPEFHSYRREGGGKRQWSTISIV